MSDPRDDLYTEALEEAYASAPAGVDALDTLEFRHPALGEPRRFVLDHGEKIGESEADARGHTQDIYGRMLRLEADAPEDGGDLVMFIATAFEVRRPASEQNRPPELAILLDNVPGDLMAALGPAAASGEPVEVVYREYLADDPDTVHYMLRGLMLKRVAVTQLRIEGRFGFGDLFNRSFPNAVYSIEESPSLGS
ncbi:DUF1833 family protein [Parvibaculum sp.]|uniref:DUF1833 family protein n=1 Tax=Parvibaculum sp. TaxID=2024848 RepID=UPI00261EC40C|nr:DUF1833 family protein [Parvibaculum sp.]MCW5727257.1 DUF1833 family protein [Parvibaculum sp.]